MPEEYGGSAKPADHEADKVVHSFRFAQSYPLDALLQRG